MSRNRAMNWEKAKRESQQQAERVSGPDRIYVRVAERNDGWLVDRYTKYLNKCSVCGDDVIVGERCQMKPPEGPGRWLIRHEACAP